MGRLSREGLDRAGWIAGVEPSRMGQSATDDGAGRDDRMGGNVRAGQDNHLGAEPHIVFDDDGLAGEALVLKRAAIKGCDVVGGHQSDLGAKHGIVADGNATMAKQRTATADEDLLADGDGAAIGHQRHMVLDATTVADANADFGRRTGVQGDLVANFDRVTNPDFRRLPVMDGGVQRGPGAHMPQKTAGLPGAQGVGPPTPKANPMVTQDWAEHDWRWDV